MHTLPLKQGNTDDAVACIRRAPQRLDFLWRRIDFEQKRFSRITQKAVKQF
jgi:hypothetical protein